MLNTLYKVYATVLEERLKQEVDAKEIPRET